jgi:uncharacterized protein (DUF2164 family)
MKMDDYKLPELRTIAKYLEIEGWNKMKRADLEAQIFLKEVSNAMISEHYNQVIKYPVIDTSNCIKLEDLDTSISQFYIRNNIPIHQL